MTDVTNDILTAGAFDVTDETQGKAVKLSATYISGGFYVVDSTDSTKKVRVYLDGTLPNYLMEGMKFDIAGVYTVSNNYNNITIKYLGAKCELVATDSEKAAFAVSQVSKLISSETYQSTTNIDIATTIPGATITDVTLGGTTTLSYTDGVLTITPTETEVTETVTITVTVGAETLATEAISVKSLNYTVVTGNFSGTVAYSGSTTTNMTGENDAELLGLDSNLFKVIGNKNDKNNNVGLNKNGYLVLYPASGNGTSIIIESNIADGYTLTITSIEIEIKSVASGATYTVNTENGSTETATYTINASKVEIKNTTDATSANQIQIKSIKVNYTITEANA